MVDLTEGAYDSLYDNYQDITFTALVPETEEGPVTFFDQAVFIGDSISMTLEAYCGASGTLGGAKFLCAGSMSPTNMLTGKILPEYPKGSGQKPAIGDSVAATGAKVVYVMLGMDNIAYGGGAGHQGLPHHSQPDYRKESRGSDCGAVRDPYGGFQHQLLGKAEQRTD